MQSSVQTTGASTQATKFLFVINLKTAKAFNIKIQQSVLVRADQVVE